MARVIVYSIHSPTGRSGSRPACGQRSGYRCRRRPADKSARLHSVQARGVLVQLHITQVPARSESVVPCLALLHSPASAEQRHPAQDAVSIGQEPLQGVVSSTAVAAQAVCHRHGNGETQAAQRVSHQPRRAADVGVPYVNEVIGNGSVDQPGHSLAELERDLARRAGHWHGCRNRSRLWHHWFRRVCIHARCCFGSSVWQAEYLSTHIVAPQDLFRVWLVLIVVIPCAPVTVLPGAGSDSWCALHV
eukprot:1174081-Rhodomonas_salina.1